MGWGKGCKERDAGQGMREWGCGEMDAMRGHVGKGPVGKRCGEGNCGKG